MRTILDSGQATKTVRMADPTVEGDHQDIT